MILTLVPGRSSLLTANRTSRAIPTRRWTSSSSELFKQAANELDDAKRKQLYDRIQVLVNADIPSHYLYALKAIDAFSRRVGGVTPHKGDRLDYNDALVSWSVAS